MSKPLIVSRHEATIAWLREQINCEAEVLSGNATFDDVRGRVVYGNLPLNLACVAREVWAVQFDSTPPPGVELRREVMEAHGVHVAGYVVTPIE